MDTFKINCAQFNNDFIEVDYVDNKIVAYIESGLDSASITFNKETAEQFIAHFTELKNRIQ